VLSLLSNGGVHPPDRGAPEAHRAYQPRQSGVPCHIVIFSRQGSEPGDAGESSRDLHNPRARAQNLGDAGESSRDFTETSRQGTEPGDAGESSRDLTLIKTED
jgi:hypothetical protein